MNWEYLMGVFIGIVIGVPQGYRYGLNKHGTIEWQVQSNVCTHGYDWDDCPDCRH